MRDLKIPEIMFVTVFSRGAVVELIVVWYSLLRASHFGMNTLNSAVHFTRRRIEKHIGMCEDTCDKLAKNLVVLQSVNSLVPPISEVSAAEEELRNDVMECSKGLIEARAYSFQLSATTALRYFDSPNEIIATSTSEILRLATLPTNFHRCDPRPICVFLEEAFDLSMILDILSPVSLLLGHRNYGTIHLLALTGLSLVICLTWTFRRLMLSARGTALYPFFFLFKMMISRRARPWRITVMLVAHISAFTLTRSFPEYPLFVQVLLRLSKWGFWTAMSFSLGIWAVGSIIIVLFTSKYSKHLTRCKLEELRFRNREVANAWSNRPVSDLRLLSDFALIDVLTLLDLRGLPKQARFVISEILMERPIIASMFDHAGSIPKTDTSPLAGYSGRVVRILDDLGYSRRESLKLIVLSVVTCVLTQI